MCDSESISSDNSNNEPFPNDFIEDISNYSKFSDSEDDDFSYDTNVSSLTLEVGLSFLTWKATFSHIKLWADFLSIRGLKTYNLSVRNKQFYVTAKGFIIINQINHQSHIE